MSAVKGFVRGVNGLCGIKRVLYLFVSALLFALPFMTKSLVSHFAFLSCSAVFGWCGLSALFITVFDFNKTSKRVLCSLFCFFFAFYFFVYSWFVSLYPLDFAGLGALESVGVILIPLTLIPIIHSTVMTACVFFAYAAAKGIKSDALRALLISFGYVLGEFFQSVGTFAFPWTRLFIGQTEFPVLLQSASLFGSYFVTFVIVLVNALLAFSLVNTEKNTKRSTAFFLAAVLVFASNLVFGLVRIVAVEKSQGRKMEAVILQGNIPSGIKWTGEVDEKEVYLELAESVRNFDADIAVMPETAFPVTVNPYDEYVADAEKTLVHISKLLDAELFSGAFYKENGNNYNSILVYNSKGISAKPYNKNHIVPFGEFLPYRNIIEKLAPVLAEINMLSSDISRGGDFYPLETEQGKAACLVCFDSIFSDVARKQVKNGGEFIVVVTNDSWYKASSAIYQHADHAAMRAIENNRPVIRSANTGVSRIIDSLGRVRRETKVNERTAVMGEVYITDEMTLYTYIGDVFVLVCALAIAAVYLFAKIKKKPSA